MVASVCVDVNFPLSVQLDPKQTVTKNLEISVPTSEDPGAFVILLKGWSAGEPVKSVEKGTYDILELGVFVSIRSSNNIVFNITDQEAIVTPAPYAPNALDPNCHVLKSRLRNTSILVILSSQLQEPLKTMRTGQRKSSSRTD